MSDGQRTLVGSHPTSGRVSSLSLDFLKLSTAFFHSFDHCVRMTEQKQKLEQELERERKEKEKEIKDMLGQQQVLLDEKESRKIWLQIESQNQLESGYNLF